MALAIATGVPPQHGLYTAIVAGAIIALTGGARFNVSGPTAAFVVILFPIVQQYGLGGLLIASMMAGVILVALGLARMGRLIQFVPYPVVLGFTSGIAVVIAVLQIPDFLGLETGPLGEHFVDNISIIARALSTINPLELGVGLFALVCMLAWPRLRIPIPAPLVGLVIGAIAAFSVNQWLVVVMRALPWRRSTRASPGNVGGDGDWDSTYPADIHVAVAVARRRRRAAEPQLRSDPGPSRPGHCNRHAWRHRVAVVRCGVGWPDENKARSQRRIDRPGPGQYRRAALSAASRQPPPLRERQPISAAVRDRRLPRSSIRWSCCSRSWRLPDCSDWCRWRRSQPCCSSLPGT